MINVKKINENVNESVDIQQKYVSDCLHLLMCLKLNQKESGTFRNILTEIMILDKFLINKLTIFNTV